MQGQRTFIDELKHQYKYGGMTLRILFSNVAVFLVIQVVLVFGRLSGNEIGSLNLIGDIFVMSTDPFTFIYKPWTLITSIFAHIDFWHILFNMFFFYVTGRMFEQLFDQKRLLYTYILAGIAGGLLEMLAFVFFPKAAGSAIIGASGGVLGVFMAVAFYRPNLKVFLFGLLPVRLIILAIGFLLIDFLALGRMDGTAHFAHLGGAIIGMLSIQNLNSSNNMINFFQRIGDSILRLFSGKPSMKVKKGGSNPRFKTDEEYAQEKKNKQQEIDRILDKISKSGYESLTKKEKDFLFNQSKNG